MTKNELKIKPIIYAISMFFFFLLAYLFIIVGIDTKTKLYVNYHETSTTNYRITLLPNDIYDSDNIDTNQHYLSSLIDDLIISFNYQNTFSEVVSGYYKYNINASLVIYDQNINNPVVKKNYSIIEDKYIILNQGNLTNFSLNDHFVINYDEYLQTYQEITKKYNLNVLGNLLINIDFYEYLGFSSLTKDQEYVSTITINIPISDTTFKTTINDLNNNSNFSEYSKHEDINYFAITLSLIFLAIAISFLVLVLHTIKSLYHQQLIYQNDLHNIISKYDDIIITTNKFYNFKKYNLIYVASFDELLEVYHQTNSLIMYKELKRHYYGVFVIISGENAWIYPLKNK